MNRPGTTRRLLAGLGAATSLTALLVGVPIILAVLAGWPLPRTLPDVDQVKAVLGSRAELPSATVVKAVAVVGWIAWLEIALAIVAETTAHLRGRTVPRLRLPGAGGAQVLAAHLVTSVLLLAGTRQAAPTPQPLTAVLTVASTSPAVTHAPESAMASPSTVDYTVRPGDWLSTIARDQLGDLHRYPEIAELNTGRPQPDGRSLEDVDLIRPGWLLRLPSTAVVPPVHSSPEAAPASEEITSLDTTPGLDGASSAAFPGMAEETPGTDQSSPVPATAPETPPVQPTPGLPSAPAPPSSGPGPAANDPGATPAVPWNAPTGVIPAVVAGIAIARLAKLRANQQRQRRRGRTIARPAPSLRDRETHIRAIADQDAPAWVDAATRRLWTALEAIPPDDIPAVTAVRAGSLGVELLLDRVAPVPPPGFVAGDEGRTWRLDHHGDLAALTALIDGQSSALPGLLHLGDTPEGPLWLNLEQAGTLSIEGDPERVQAFIAAAAIHLSTAPWSDALNVLHVGGDPSLAVLDHVRLASQEEAVAVAPTVPGLSARHRMATRITPPALEALAPTVVVAAPGSLDADAATALSAAAQPDTGLVLIVPGSTAEAPWRLVLAPDGDALLEPLKIRLTNRSDVGTTDALAALIAHGAEHEDIALHEPAAPPPPLQADESEEQRALPVRVRILGPVEIDWAGPTPRTKAAEIVAYLATRDRPVPSGRLKLDVWPAPPGDEIAAATFRTNVSRARSALGTGPNGEHHLCDAEQGSYRVGPGITSDWQRFKQLVARARQASSDEAIELYREAISLIRGAPFADSPKGAYHWIHGDGLVWEIETAVAEAAERFADLALDAGEHRLADWAARQALKVTPHREPLYQLRMKAAAQANDHDALERIYRELRLMVRSLGELEEPRPETVALYQALTGRPAERLTKAG